MAVLVLQALAVERGAPGRAAEQEAARAHVAGRQSALLESDDGLVWKQRAYFNETAGDETAFLFEQDGSVLAIGRNGGGKEAFLLRSQPPYTSWNRQQFDRAIGGPLVAKWGEHLLVGGRHTTKEKGAKTSLCWLVGEQLHEFAELPSGGDCSYPGLYWHDDELHVTYYSSHEGKPAIYYARVKIK